MTLPDPTTPIQGGGTNEGAAPPVGAAPETSNDNGEDSSPAAEEQPFSEHDRRYLLARAVDLGAARKLGLRSGEVDKYNPKRVESEPKYGAPGMPGKIYALHLVIRYQKCLDGIKRVRLKIHESRVVLRMAEENSGNVVVPEKVQTYDGWKTQKDVPVVPWLSRPVLAVAADASAPLAFAEGPVKAISLICHGFRAIGLGGAEAGFADKRHPGRIHPELGRLLWRGRKVFLIPDAGHRYSVEVCRGTARLAHLLRSEGAIVRIVRLPLVRAVDVVAMGKSAGVAFRDLSEHLLKLGWSTKETGDLGPDDYLALHRVLGKVLEKDPATHARDRLQELLDAAVPGDPVEWAKGPGCATSASTGPVDTAAAGEAKATSEEVEPAAIETAPVDPAASEPDGADATVQPDAVRGDQTAGGATGVDLLSDLLFCALVAEAGEAVVVQVAEALKVPLRSLRKALDAAAAKASSRKDESEHPYVEKDGCTWTRTGWLNGEPILRRLANFTARITVDRVEEDGDEDPRRVFVVQGHLAGGSTLPQVQIEASEWLERSWVPTAWGPKPIIEPGRDTWGHLLAAVQTFSTPKEERIKGSMGWVREGDAWRYAFPELGDSGGYGIPAAVESMDAVREALLSSLQLVTDLVGGQEVTFPVYATAWLAPMAQWIKPDSILWLSGESGSCKSSLASVIQSHFGRFSYTSLPESWISTPNAIEHEMWRRKDAVLVLDNFVPGLAHDLQAKANRIIQATGDHAARKRLGRDARIRPARQPRGVVIATGEEVPSGSSSSTVGRLLVLRVQRDQLSLDGLVKLSKEAPKWPLLMRAYTNWIARDVEARVQYFREQLEVTTENYRVGIPGLHPRTAGNVAHLIAALCLFREWACEVGAGAGAFVNQDYWAEWIRYSMCQLARTQASYLDNSRPSDRYMEVLRALLASGQALLSHRDHELGERDVGWHDDDAAYLHPELAWAAIQRFVGGPAQWPYSKTEMHRALVEAGFVIRPTAGGADAHRRLTTEIRLGVGTGDGKAKRRVLVVPRAALAEATGYWAKPSPGPVAEAVLPRSLGSGEYLGLGAERPN